MRRPSDWIRTLLLALALGGIGSAHEDLQIQIDRLTRQIEAEPGRAVLHFRRGELHRMHEDWAASRLDLERAVALDPALFAAELSLGRLASQAGDPARAKAHLDRFLAREPEHGEALMERGRARVRLGDRPAAIEDFNRALERLEAAWPENYLERSEALRSEGRPDEAMRGLEAGVRKLGPALPLQLALLDLELETARFDAALTRLDEIARASERKDLWLARRGEILRQAGRRDEANRAYASALAAIESLPAARKKTKFTRDLESKVRAAMEATNEKR